MLRNRMGWDVELDRQTNDEKGGVGTRPVRGRGAIGRVDFGCYTNWLPSPEASEVQSSRPRSTRLERRTACRASPRPRAAAGPTPSRTSARDGTMEESGTPRHEAGH